MKQEHYQSTKQEIESLQKNSKGRLRSANLLLKEKEYRDSISRSYYAILDSARAFLLMHGHFAKTHSGVLMLFNRKFVKTDKVPAKYARIFSDAQKYREEADYKFLENPTKEKAQDIYKRASQFVEMVDKKLEQELKKKKGNIKLTTILL